MFNFTIAIPELLISMGIALFFSIYVAILIIIRYKGQLGYDFVLYALVVFSLPSLILIVIPFYIILSTKGNDAIRALFVCALLIIFMRLARKLKKKIIG